MKRYFYLLVVLLSTNAFALPVLDKAKVIGTTGRVELLPDHQNPKLFYYDVSSYFVCKGGDGKTPQAFFFSDTKDNVPYVSVAYTLCPEMSLTPGITAAEAEATIEAFSKTTGATVRPLFEKIEVRPDGLWRDLFDALGSKVVYQCEPDANSLKVFCNLYGEGGRSFNAPSPESFDARLLYEMYIKRAGVLNGYFHSSVEGYIQAKVDSPRLQKLHRDFQVAFWAEPNFVNFPENANIKWRPAE